MELAYLGHHQKLYAVTDQGVWKESGNREYPTCSRTGFGAINKRRGEFASSSFLLVFGSARHNVALVKDVLVCKLKCRHGKNVSKKCNIVIK